MLEQPLARLLACSHVVRLATTNGMSAPWIGAAFFVERGPFALDLLLGSGSRTVGHLLIDPRVAVMVDGADAFAPFAQGEGRALIVDHANGEVARRLRSKTPESAPLLARPGLVAVRVQIDTWWLTVPDHDEVWRPAHELRRPQLVGFDECPDYL
jgi:hypothetical protein